MIWKQEDCRQVEIASLLAMAGATWDSKATSTSRDLLRILKSLWPDIEVTEVTEETARQGGLCDVFCSSWYLHAPTYNVNLDATAGYTRHTVKLKRLRPWRFVVNSPPRPRSCHVVTGPSRSAPKGSGTTTKGGTIGTTSEGCLSSGLGPGWILKTVWWKGAIPIFRRPTAPKSTSLKDPKTYTGQWRLEFVFKEICRRVMFALQHGHTKYNMQCFVSYCFLLIFWLWTDISEWFRMNVPLQRI